MKDISYTINGQRKHYQGCSCWKDLDQHNFVAVFKILEEIQDRPDLRFTLPILLSNIPDFEYKDFHEIEAEQLANSFTFLLTDSDLPSDWLIPVLEIEHLRLYGPDSALYNLVFEEFLYAEGMVDNYYKTKDDKWLDQLIGILFRIKSDVTISGDVRTIFNHHEVDARAELVKSSHKGFKKAVLANYNGAKMAMATKYKAVFEINKKDDDDDEPQPDKVQNNTFSWLETALRLANNSQSEFNVVKQSNLYEVMANLNTKIKDNKALKLEIENAQKSNK